MSAASNALEEDTTALPESDRLGDFLHPRQTIDLIGHGSAEEALLSAFASNRLHHGWLISGPEGIGKATLAYRFARFLLSPEHQRDPSGKSLEIVGETPTSSQIRAQSHPNLLVLRRQWSSKTERFAQDITVGNVRGLRSFLGNTAADAGWRAVVVDRADDLNANAANALLKALEEPPPRCVFLLVSAAPGRLPVTIRSRCRPLMLNPLENQDLLKAVRAALEGAGDESASDQLLADCAVLAQGSVREALQLISHNGLELYETLLSALRGLPDVDYAALHKFADGLTARGAEARYELALTLLEGMMARMMLQAATGRGAIGDEASLADRLMRTGALAQWTELWETIQRNRADMAALNLDKKSFVLGTFFQLEETARLGI